MSLTKEAYEERKWRGFTELRKLLKGKKINDKSFYGLTTAHDNFSDYIYRIFELSILLKENAKTILERMNNIDNYKIYELMAELKFLQNEIRRIYCKFKTNEDDIEKIKMELFKKTRSERLILNIPHSSTFIPNYEDYILDKKKIDDEILKLTDWYVDDIFITENNVKVKADFSRIFCDTERFVDGRKEKMAKFGMGVLYVKTDDGRLLRKISRKRKKEILNKYYYEYHKKLNSIVNLELRIHNRAVIIDCHSFPNEPFKRDLDKRNNRPDINLGIDEYHTPEKLINISRNYFEEKGYRIGINCPYSGTIVPSEHYKKNKNVVSIMIEINRKLYLKPTTTEKSDNYDLLKKDIERYLDIVRDNIGIFNPYKPKLLKRIRGY